MKNVISNSNLCFIAQITSKYSQTMIRNWSWDQSVKRIPTSDISKMVIELKEVNRQQQSAV